MVILGVIFHAIGGFAAGSFYLPLKKVTWSWESGWLINGLFSWLLAPIIIALLTTEDLASVYLNTDKNTFFWTFFFGLLWGVGGLTFGLSMRYLGLSLGYAIALGFCAIFGTLIPPIYEGEFLNLFKERHSQVVLLGIALCLVGIILCGVAGKAKQDHSNQKGDEKTIQLGKGLLVAFFSGLLSACMAFAFIAGEPIAEASKATGTGSLFVNNSVLVIVFLGGITINGIWCLYLNKKNKSFSDYTDKSSPLRKNYFFAALAGVTWYLQFMFYGMGHTKMGSLGFASWTLHMAFIILFSNIWGLYLKEWNGSGRKALTYLISGIACVAISTVLIGLGGNLKH